MKFTEHQIKEISKKQMLIDGKVVVLNLHSAAKKVEQITGLDYHRSKGIALDIRAGIERSY